VLPRKVLSEVEIEIIFKAVRTETHLGFRDRVILETLYGTGIRRSELVGLTLEHVDLQHGKLLIRQGKGRRDRYALFGNVLGAWLTVYLNRVRPILVANHPEENALFISKDGKGVTIPTLAARLRKYSKMTGIAFSAHTFRHSFATHLLKHGASILYIKELLGHRNLTTTEVYTRVYPADLKKIIEAFHPRYSLPNGQGV
jgi:integrase/recombinase XerD